MLTKSPFPGMDPYLEGALWPDVHGGLTRAIQEIIAPKIAPKYVARVEIYTVEDMEPESEVGITYPDVAVLRRQSVHQMQRTYVETDVMTPPDAIAHPSVKVRIPVIYIRDTEENRLVTCIEILSPVNKRGHSWLAYQQKRADLHLSDVNLLEIDLLRRGKRHLVDFGLPEMHNVFSLWRVGTGRMEIWTNRVQQPLPVLPVPLDSPDPDVLLPLRQALDMIYHRGLYYLSIDYHKASPPPTFSEEEKKWMKKLVEEAEQAMQQVQ